MAKKKIPIHKIYKDPREGFARKYVKYQGHAAHIITFFGSNRYQAEQAAKRDRTHRRDSQTLKAKPRVRAVKTEKGWATIQYNERGSPYATSSSWLDKGVVKKLKAPKSRAKSTKRTYAPKKESKAIRLVKAWNYNHQLPKTKKEWEAFLRGTNDELASGYHSTIPSHVKELRSNKAYAKKKLEKYNKPRAKPGEVTIKKAKALDYGDTLFQKDEYNADGTRVRWNVTGRVKTWKTRPDDVEIPVRYGLRESDTIKAGDLHRYSTKDGLAPWRKKQLARQKRRKR